MQTITFITPFEPYESGRAMFCSSSQFGWFVMTFGGKRRVSAAFNDDNSVIVGELIKR